MGAEASPVRVSDGRDVRRQDDQLSVRGALHSARMRRQLRGRPERLRRDAQLRDLRPERGLQELLLRVRAPALLRERLRRRLRRHNQ